MDREIKFRGKRIDNGEWVYGDLIHDFKEEVGILPHDNYYQHVDPETIGQYTGLKDRDGKEIYENDILQDKYGLCIVVWEDISWAVKSPGSEAVDYTNRKFFENCSVVGNIYEDAELLKQ